jgi:NAD(P)-dependent dehydrogenase (short-subunit alcohol dehydrogenase family)
MRQKTIIVTGASQGIGAGIASLFLDRGYNVVGTSRHISSKNELRQSDHLALVDGDIGQTATAQHVVTTALERFGSVDALVNNAGILFSTRQAPFPVVVPVGWRTSSRLRPQSRVAPDLIIRST